MLLIAVSLALAGIGALARLRWRPAVRAVAWYGQLRPSASACIRASPGTFAYLAILSVTTWVLLGSSQQVVDLLLREHSTSLHRLAVDPVRVLVRSAFWTPGYAFLLWAVAFAIMLASAERWLGTARCALIFAAGHVLATLGAATVLWMGIRFGWAPRALADGIDVGVSYGFAAVAAVFSYRLPEPWRWRWAATAIAAGLVGLFFNQTFTDVGHLFALAIGFGFYPLTTSVIVRSRAAHPVWALPPTTPTRTG